MATSMSAKPRWNERTRLMLTLELAVVLPAAALVILSAMHLKSIERDRGIQAAFQRDFSQVLAIAEKQMNHKAYELIDDVRDQFPASGAACTETMDRILANHPYVAYLFVYDPAVGIIFRAQPSKAQDPALRPERDYLNGMFNGWMQVEYKDTLKELIEKENHGRRVGFEDWVPRGDKHQYIAGEIFRTRDMQGQNNAIGGMVFDPDFLQKEFFPEALDSVLSHQEEKAENSHAVLMLHPRYEWTPLATSAGWDGGTPEVERNLDGAFPSLTLAIKLPGTTLAAMEHKFVHMDFTILGAIALLLTAGIVLTHRNISREMALARLKSDFVSNVSHELRTPLSLIRLYAETLEMGRLKSPEKYQEYYGIIRKESERLTALINNILDFSRIEAGRKEYDFRETDVRELVHNTLESYRYQIEQNGFIFEEKLAENLPSLRVDREAIARSLLNLVNNALKYSQDRKFIGVNLFRANGTVKLEVEDHGIGIPFQEQGKIFEKFYRVGDPLVHNTKGSGLGLALVRHIVHAHGGEVSVDSAPGQGSKFTISLPVKVVVQQPGQLVSNADQEQKAWQKS
jgi:signal transduction histidine kinase